MHARRCSHISGQPSCRHLHADSDRAPSLKWGSQDEQSAGLSSILSVKVRRLHAKSSVNVLCCGQSACVLDQATHRREWGVLSADNAGQRLSSDRHRPKCLIVLLLCGSVKDRHPGPAKVRRAQPQYSLCMFADTHINVSHAQTRRVQARIGCLSAGVGLHSPFCLMGQPAHGHAQ